MNRLTLGHSPDPDDAFMFYALAKELIDSHGYEFEHILQDIQTLNQRATRGELDITTRNLLLKGGSEGPAVMPGSAKTSRLFKLISHTEKPHMPAKGGKLPAGLIAKFAEWIDMCAPYGKTLVDSKLADGEMKITESDREYWAFTPLKMTTVPKAVSYTHLTLPTKA